MNELVVLLDPVNQTAVFVYLLLLSFSIHGPLLGNFALLAGLINAREL